MNVELLINSEDRTSLVDINTLIKTDIVNDREDTLDFDIIDLFPADELLQEDGDFLLQEDLGKIVIVDESPISVNDTVVLNIDGTKVFGGVVVSIRKITRGDRNVVWQVHCADYTFFLNKVLITERYEAQTANAIIADIVSQLNVISSGFTTTNVDAAITIASIGFNRLSARQCIEKIADLLGYYWYVDYDKDIHFFASNSEVAPFTITDTNGKYVYDSLIIEDDISQLRNVVFIQGAEVEGTTRVEVYEAVDDQKHFPLANKFASIPTIEVNSVEFTSGVDFITSDDDMSVAWNFNQKYLRFIDALDSTKVVTVTGVPLYPLIVRVQDSSSIDLYGEYQHTRKDETVRTRDEAIRLANAELDAYAEPTNEGSFKTYTSGLKAGQVLTIQSDLRDVNDNFLIERVTMRIDAVDRAIYDVQFSSIQKQGIVSVLQALLTDEKLTEGESEQLLALAQLSDNFYFSDELVSIDVTGAPYHYDNTADTGKWNMSTWS